MPRKKKGNSDTLNVNFMECNMLVCDIERFNKMLQTEKTKTSDAESKVTQLSKELEEIRLQIEKEKSVTETYINQDREKELEKIEEQRIANDIQVEKQKNKSLQEELLTARISYKELTLAYKIQVEQVIKQAAALQQELETQRKSNQDKVSQDQQLLHKLRTEQEDLCKQMTQEMTFLRQSSEEMEKSLQTDVDKTKASYLELSSRYEADVSAGRQEVEKLQMGLNKEIMTHTQTMMENLWGIYKLRAEQDAEHEKLSEEVAALKQTSIQKEEMYQTELDNLKTELVEIKKLHEEALAEQRKKPPSFWKRVRHFLGLRKSEKRKKNKTTAN